MFYISIEAPGKDNYFCSCRGLSVLDITLCFRREIIGVSILSPGQERFRSLTPSYYRHAHGCLLFFNVNTRKSFEHVESWWVSGKLGGTGEVFGRIIMHISCRVITLSLLRGLGVKRSPGVLNVIGSNPNRSAGMLLLFFFLVNLPEIDFSGLQVGGRVHYLSR